MKKSQIYNILILSSLLFLMCSGFAQAKTPNYVGVQENTTYEWNTTYDKGPLKDYYEDAEEEGWISEAYMDYLKDSLATEEDLVKAKITILDVNDEETDPRDEDGVKITYNYYLMAEDEEYELEKQDETFAVWKYDEDIYGDDWNFATESGMHFFDFDWDEDIDDPDPDEHERYIFLEGENPWFISTKVDWSEVVEELEDTYEDDLNYDDVSIRAEKDANKLYITLDEDEDDEVGPEKWIIEYDDNGILSHYEWQYNGDPIVIVQTTLDQIQVFVETYFIFIIIGIVALVVIIIVIIAKKKR